jgi:hypothetical protein
MRFWTKRRTFSTVYFRKRVMMKSIWMWTFIRALPRKVAVKKVRKGMRKCPQVMPARSNRGLGMEAHSRTVMNPYLCNICTSSSFNLSIIGTPFVFVVCSNFSISLNCSFSSSTSSTSILSFSSSSSSAYNSSCDSLFLNSNFL